MLAPPPPPPPPALEYRDAGRVVHARRLSPTAVTLEYPALGVRVRAGVDAWAIVQLPADEAAARAEMARLGLVPDRALMPSAGLWRVRDARGGDGLDTAARLAPLVGPAGPLREAVPDLRLVHRAAGRRETPPDDPRYRGQWYLDRIDIADAWSLSDGDPSVTVVVVDNGCDLVHPDLAAKLDPGRDTLDGDDDPSAVRGGPGTEHGTACAGLVAAATDNGEGIAGTCPECRLRCVRLLPDDERPTPISADVEAFTFALETDAAVVSNSWGFVEAIPAPGPLATAIGEVYDRGRGGKGALVLFAAGNEDREVRDDELLGVRGVIGVGALNIFDEATVFTNHGATVDVSAPAGTITTDVSGPGGGDPGDYTTHFGGTSSAAPVAAGVAGLLVSAAPALRASELERILIETARPAPYAQPDARGHDRTYGWGIVDPARAIRRATGVPETPPDAAVPDAALADAAVPDATGEAADAASSSLPDAALADAAAAHPDAAAGGDGGGCAASRAPGGAVAALLLALGLARARRRPSPR